MPDTSPSVLCRYQLEPRRHSDRNKTDFVLWFTKSKFEELVAAIDEKMAKLMDIIERYRRAKENLTQFIEEGGVGYIQMLERIEENVKAAKAAYKDLEATKTSLQETLNQMDNFGNEVSATLEAAIEAAGSAVNAALHVDEVL